VLIELLSLGVTADALRANIGDFVLTGPVDPRFQVEGVAASPTILFFFSEN